MSNRKQWGWMGRFGDGNFYASGSSETLRDAKATAEELNQEEVRISRAENATGPRIKYFVTWRADSASAWLDYKTGQPA